MTTAAMTVTPIAWWKEPTKDQWYAYVAAWAGWTLDAFDFTAFLLIIAPIAKEFNVPVPEVATVLTITLWMRLIGATASGWLADRIGRKTPLMISIAWYSVCNFLAGLAPSFFLLFLFRALLGIGMGAEWPAGAALASSMMRLTNASPSLTCTSTRHQDLRLDAYIGICPLRTYLHCCASASRLSTYGDRSTMLHTTGRSRCATSPASMSRMISCR